MYTKPWNPTRIARRVFTALQEIGGKGKLEEIAQKAGLSKNGVSVSLGNMAGLPFPCVKWIGGMRYNSEWKIVNEIPPLKVRPPKPRAPLLVLLDKDLI